ncbi:MAG: [FeFe] hydrogenase H-cluster maturation GTPase HydF [Oscillospiraceae bacterium]|jgi:small GTP-binding protein|nr:[FeFe] hydrogenase H-cluster maturation GTPase HydF [Oscillospiraceae bacterium]
MSINETPRGERLHIGIFGRRNAGKSSLLNAITGQDAAMVSPVKGTTTDPVYKAMELLPIGPVVLIDTPGIDDDSELGNLRIQKTKSILRKTDIAVLVVGSCEGEGDYEREIIRAFDEYSVKYFIVRNDFTPFNVQEIKEKIAALGEEPDVLRRPVSDLLESGDVVVLVIPIDEAAPKGRLILPQQQVIRDILDAEAVPVLTGIKDLSGTFEKLKEQPKLVITDSQVFAEAAKLTPGEIGLTSFSILMARYKGVLEDAVHGAGFIDKLKDGDKILIAEGCTHHRQCEDIGTVKIPRMLKQRTGFNFNYEFSSGGGFPEDLTGFNLIIHCGGCMQNQREMRFRNSAAREAGVPITNYGIAISYMQGILERSNPVIQ